MKYIHKNKYYSKNRNLWETEYSILSIPLFYKLSLFGKKNKYSLFKSKNKIDKAIIYTPKLTSEEAIKEFGHNKWAYPLEPYKFV